MREFGSLRQFFVLLYKGMLLRKRHYIVTFFEIVIPVFIASIFPMMESEMRSKYADYAKQSSEPSTVKYKTYEPFSPYTKYSSSSDLQFVYMPSNEIIDKFMNNSIERFKAHTDYTRTITTHTVKSEKELETYSLYTQASSSGVLLIGVVFNTFSSTMKSLPESLDYKIRYANRKYYSEEFHTNEKYRIRGPNYDTAYKNSYFLGWQTAIEETFIASKMAETGKKLDYEVSMQRFPYPERQETGKTLSIIALTPMVIGYGYFIFMLNLLRRVIEEKNNGSKELMKMMGMTDTVYWVSTFTNYFIVGFLTILITTIVYKSPLKNSFVYMKYTNFFLLFLMLLLYMTCLILFCLAFTVFFNRAVFATIAFIIVYNVSFLIFMSIYFNMVTESNFYLLPLILKLLICLLPTGNVLVMFNLIAVYETSNQGVLWTNLNEFSFWPDLNMAMVLYTMIFSCFLFAFLIWYFDKVWPWQPGVPKPFYFLFTKSYWCGTKPKQNDEIELVKQNEGNDEYFEGEPSGTVPGVTISNLSKTFQVGFQTKVAVNNLSLNIYKGQITALLGHNGAGKTTTINILTGLYTPTSGSAEINGLDILTDTVEARKGLGVCPQHNVLFDTLTVDEHLKIFAGLKGINWRDLSSEALKVLEILKLTDKRYELVKNLSGGMKRKLSLGNAIVGDSKVLFLDEPTSGLDVEARRSVWDALLNIRRDRTIILTTHYMEEADILGDRIAIMAEGEIQCSGSPMFLKRKFGTGYHLHMVKNPNFLFDETQRLLKSFIPEITVQKELENEISFALSSNSGSVFGDMFERLENSKEKLGINSCGITITTMEDVFLNVASISDLKYSKKGNRRLQNGVSMEYEDVYGSSVTMKQQNLGHQLFALLEKRFHYSKRHWSSLIIQLVLPFLLLCLCFFSIKSSQNESRAIYDPLTLDINRVYGHTEGFYYTTTNEKLTNELDNVLRQNNINTQKVSNPTHYILNYGKNNLPKYLKTLLVGGSVDKFQSDKINLTAWYNGEPYHTLPMSLLLVHTAVLRDVSTGSASITLTNAPLPRISPHYSRQANGFLEGILASVFIPLALGFVAAFVVIVPIHERTTKAQLLQLMTGVPHALYWASMFIWDFLLFFVVSILLIIPFAIFFNGVFFGTHSAAIGTTLLLFWLYGFASIPLSYLVSFIINKGNTGFSIIIAMTSIMGIAVSSTLQVVSPVSVGKTNAIANAFTWVFRIFPPFSVSIGFSRLFSIAFANAYCDTVSEEDLEFNCQSPSMNSKNTLFRCCKDICGDNCLKQTPFITWDNYACGRDVFFLFMDGVVLISFLTLLETSFFRTMCRHLKTQIQRLKKSVVGEIIRYRDFEDSDVISEEQRIHNLYATHRSTGGEALLALDLTKVFRNFYAVDHLSFGIHPEECFGLLGVNGAGKTTTFRMLTGDCHPTSGNALSTDCSLILDTKKFQTYLGYCPQFDPLIDRLTGRETLTLFARLRGLSGSELRDRVNQLIKMTDLHAHADKQSRLYSGGNKRKLSVGISLIGSPPLILLDEPTAGVDPVSRRKIWNILAQARNFTKAAIILTTHSMEESEALCNRLAIMVNGRFKCLGSIQQLKSKFGQGYTLILKMRRETSEDPQRVNAIKDCVARRLNGAELKDDHQGMLQYHVINPAVRLSQLFKLMEAMKAEFNLEDYLISDTSLEQIFLTFARTQRVTE